MALKDRKLVVYNTSVSHGFKLMDGDKLITIIKWIPSPTSNCQVSGLLTTDEIYRIPDAQIIHLFAEIRRLGYKSQILVPISNKRSIKKIDKLISENKLHCKITNETSFGKIYLIYV